MRRSEFLFKEKRLHDGKRPHERNADPHVQLFAPRKRYHYLAPSVAPCDGAAFREITLRFRAQQPNVLDETYLMRETETSSLIWSQFGAMCRQTVNPLFYFLIPSPRALGQNRYQELVHVVLNHGSPPSLNTTSNTGRHCLQQPTLR